MQTRRRGLPCCDRCGGPGIAARVARRPLLMSAVLGHHTGRPAAGGPALGFPADQPVSARAAPGGGHWPSGVPRDGAAPGGSHGLACVVTGIVLDASPQILVIGAGAGERRLVLPADAAVWRGGSAEPTALRAGETVTARLLPGRRDVAGKIWAGIGRVTGTIVTAEPGCLLVDEGTTRQRQAVAISSRAASRIQVRFPRLQPGSLIDVIGLRRDGVLEALVPATAQPSYLASRVSRPRWAARPAGGVLSGSATWHEPAPGEHSEGAAYPAVDAADGCQETAATGGSCSVLPYLAVGSRLPIRNDCNGASAVLAVTGCAAAARLFHDRCLTCDTSPRGRIADLTLASFAAMGGDLERGCFNATVTLGGRGMTR
jgi:hypothetical protein